MKHRLSPSRVPDLNAATVTNPGINPRMPGALLTRRQAGAALRAAGYPVADKTLATMASRGGGPAYRRFGARVLYRWEEALAWAEARLSGPVRTSSENDCLTQPN
jgi:hypothetical protein